MVQLHKSLGTWRHQVNAYIALTHFSREKFIEAGLPADRIHVKPNFIHDRYGPDYERKEPGEYALFVGRLADEKGVEDLLAAWSKLSIPLIIAGDGPLRNRVCAASNSWIQYAGACGAGKIALLMRQARFLVVPSRWYEVFPMVLLEAFSAGLPVVASRIGSLAELVVEGHTGRLVLPGDSGSLARTCADLFESRANLEYMSHNAREEYFTKYTPDVNYRILMNIYEKAFQSVGTRD